MSEDTASELNLEPMIEAMRDAHKLHYVGGWTRIPDKQARSMVSAVISEWEQRKLQQEVLDIIDAPPSSPKAPPVSTEALPPLGRQIALARNKWFASDAGQNCLTSLPTNSGGSRFLHNRLEAAFLAGVDAVLNEEISVNADVAKKEERIKLANNLIMQHNGAWCDLADMLGIKAWSIQHPRFVTGAVTALLQNIAELEKDRARLAAFIFAFDAAKRFIESHVADPDITEEMRRKYQEYLDAKEAVSAAMSLETGGQQ